MNVPRPEDTEKVAERFRLTIAALGISKAQISRDTGIPENRLTNATSASNRISVPDAGALCREYNLTTDWIYSGDMGWLSQINPKFAQKVKKLQAQGFGTPDFAPRGPQKR
jgi:hypothetical protein